MLTFGMASPVVSLTVRLLICIRKFSIFVGGMILQNGFAKVCHLKVRIDFRSRKILMTEQLLDYTQVSAVLKQMSGE